MCVCVPQYLKVQIYDSKPKNENEIEWNPVVKPPISSSFKIDEWHM